MFLEVWAQEVFRTLSPLKSELKLFVENEDEERDTQEEGEKINEAVHGLAWI